jgi:hypothetical protein
LNVTPFSYLFKKYCKIMDYVSSSEYWSVLCPSTPLFRKLGLRLRYQLQFKWLGTKHVLKSHTCK